MTDVALDRWTPRSCAVIAACGVGNIVGATTVINNTFSSFLIPVSTSLHLQRSQFSFVLTILSLVGVVAYPLSGRLIDRFGARPVALAGNLLFGGMVMSLALLPPIPWALYAMFVGVGVAATLPSTVLMARVASTWFQRSRGLALGLSGGLAFGVGGMIIPPAAQALLDAFGWRVAYFGLGAIVIGVGFPVFLLFLREAPIVPPAPGPATRAGAEAEAAPGLSAAGALRQPAFWILLASVALGAGSISALVTHMAPLVTDRGISPMVATGALVGLFVTNAAWQIVIGLVLDRGRTPRIAAPFVLPAVAGAALLALARDPALIVVGGVLIGMGCGTEYGLLPFCIPRYFGFRAYGEVYGWIFGAIMLIQGFTPFLMDVLYEATGSYRPVMAGLCVMLVGCAAIILALPRYRFGAVQAEGVGRAA